MDPGRPIIALLLVVISAPLSAAGLEVFELRNQHPFLHIYGLPPLQQAALVEQGRTECAAVLSIVNNAAANDTDSESITLDGETYYADFTFRRRLNERLEIGIAVPIVKHSGGFLDRMIFDWHDFWGMSNSKRKGAHNQLDYFYERDGSVQQQITTSSSGVGDVQLSAAMPIIAADAAGSRHVTLRFSVKLPTGNSDDVHGSGAVDAALGIHAQDSRQLFGRELAYLGFAGLLGLGDGDVLADQQRSAVPYGGLAATWHATARLGITAQLQAQGAYVDSDLDELGSSSIQLAVGGAYRWPVHGVALRFALVEDVISDAAPDFGLYLGIHVAGGR